MNFLKTMTNKITKTDRFLWLAETHVLMVSMSFFFLLLSITILIIESNGGLTAPIWQKSAAFALLFGLELAILGFAAIAVRSIITKEVAYVSGHLQRPQYLKGDKAVSLGMVLLFFSAIIQLIVVASLDFLFAV